MCEWITFKTNSLINNFFKFNYFLKDVNKKMFDAENEDARDN